AGARDTRAWEGRTTTASLLVGRNERLPFPTRVFFSVTGTAIGGLTIGRDYTMSNMIFPLFGGSPYVDIPANETFVICTLTPINDSRVEGTETAIFTILPNVSYELGTPTSGTIDIADDDGNILIGTSKATAPPT